MTECNCIHMPGRDIDGNQPCLYDKKSKIPYCPYTTEGAWKCKNYKKDSTFEVIIAVASCLAFLLLLAF